MEDGRWYVESESGTIPVEDSYHRALEDAVSNELPTTQLSSGGFTYTVRFVYVDGETNVSGTQTNNVTGKQRNLHRLPKTGYIWQYCDQNRSWLNYYNTEYLSQQYNLDPSSSITIVSSDHSEIYNIDFRDQLETNIETGVSRKIRRVGDNLNQNNEFATKEASSQKPVADGVWKELSSSEKDVCNDRCPICLCDLNETSDVVVELLGCSGHHFHKSCAMPLYIDGAVKCPICSRVSGPGVMTGGQPPDGTMNVRIDHNHCVKGISSKIHVIVIHYHFPSGTQTEKHPFPGKSYRGTTREAYLPDTPEGREILELFKIAWSRRLLFTVGTSITTGQSNCVVWAGIHHKTSVSGGTYGYPDDTYFDRVKEELRLRGVS